MDTVLATALNFVIWSDISYAWAREGERDRKIVREWEREIESSEVSANAFQPYGTHMQFEHDFPLIIWFSVVAIFWPNTLIDSTNMWSKCVGLLKFDWRDE